jgi:hypothetical protein
MMNTVSARFAEQEHKDVNRGFCWLIFFESPIIHRGFVI